MSGISRLAHEFVDEVRRDGRETIDLMGSVAAAARNVLDDEIDAGLPDVDRSHFELVVLDIETALEEHGDYDYE